VVAEVVVEELVEMRDQVVVEQEETLDQVEELEQLTPEAVVVDMEKRLEEQVELVDLV
tara:strand:+ start:538 stop:711 length:174 start_codon:yes stop_codon:yes gene_type:complete